MENWLQMAGVEVEVQKDICSLCKQKSDTELPYVYDNYCCTTFREKKQQEQSYAMYKLSYGYNHGRTMR